jgi:hypothetical protein
MTLLVLFVVVTVIGSLGRWFAHWRRRRRLLNHDDPVSPHWLNEHAYDKDHGDRDA